MKRCMKNGFFADVFNFDEIYILIHEINKDLEGNYMAFLQKMLLIVLIINPVFCMGQGESDQLKEFTVQTYSDQKKTIIFKALRAIKASLCIGMGTSFLVYAHELGSP